MNLPSEFIEEVSRLLGKDELESFQEAMHKPCPVSIRLNPNKMTDDVYAELIGQLGLSEENKVAWCEHGYYLDSRPSFTMDPLFHAGAYYVQEASSMFIAHLVKQYVGEMAVNALDLCAAPGGKSTLLLSCLSDNSTLIANEINGKRARILQENITKWGARNVTVTNNCAADFKHLHEHFDLILCDVPCSGEGMFRKDEGAIREWSLQNVEMCWQRQREIVSDIWGCLKEGGYLIYSTCTYNTHENEENIQWISRELGAEILPCNAPEEWNIKGNMLQGADFDCCHFMPHRVEGEGFFCAILKKNVVNEPLTYEEGCCRRQSKNKKPALSILSTEMSGNETMPCASCEVDRTTALQYLRGEALRLEPSVPRGIVTITYKGLPLGPVKNIGNRANNLYPKEWRIKKQISI